MDVGSTRSKKERQMRMRILLTALAAVGVAVVLGAMTATPVAATPRHANGQITFDRFNPTLGERQIYVVNPDGTGERLIGGPTDAAECPFWSPDGTRIATCGSELGNVYSSTIWNPDDGSYRLVPNPDPANLFLPCTNWSHSGTRLACEGFGISDPSLNGIYTIRSFDGGGLVRVTSTPGGDDIPGDFSPDGNRMVFCRTTLNALFVVNSNGTGLKQITPQNLVPGDFCGSWSPHGNEIVFSRQVTPDVHSSIWVVHADGTGLHEINVQPASACGGANADPSALGCNEPTWSPDGTKFAFTRSHNNDVDGEIYTVNVDGTGLAQVTNAPGSGSPDWGTHPLTP
jgi:Tol biopolymer transport system component